MNEPHEERPPSGGVNWSYVGLALAICAAVISIVSLIISIHNLASL